MTRRRDSSIKFVGSTRQPTEQEKRDSEMGWYTYDVYLENGTIEVIQETSTTYEMVATFFKMTRGDDVLISKIE